MDFTYGSYNLSVAAVKRHRDKVKFALERGIEECHAFGCQEAGQAEWLREWVAEIGAKMYHGSGKGADATPLIWREDLHVRRKESIRLTQPTLTKVIARVAGPARVKAKFLNTVRFGFDGRIIHAQNTHGPASIWWPPRAKLARIQFDEVAEYNQHRKVLCLVSADYNMEEDNRILNVLDRVNLRSTQAINPRNTRGRRDIDDIRRTVAPKRWQFVENGTLETPGDHRFYFARFRVIHPR